MKTPTFFFYDLETSGFNPREDRVMQFAGQRTDLALNPIGDPHNHLIMMNDDVLPDPRAVLVTGLTPQQTNAEGTKEAQFLKLFHEQIATPGTIFVGYNSVRFDDEFMRYMHYRNFYDPYEWHWQDGRSRWDLLDVARMTRALRPEGIKWPFDSSGKPSNRLELLASINKLGHQKAHDALSDVQATIDLARLIRKKQPKLFEFLLTMRDKKRIDTLVNGGQPFVYTSGKYDGQYEKTTLVSTLMAHPERSGAALVYDLRYDPAPFLKMEPLDLAETWQWKKDAEEARLPVKTLQFNRCPAIAPMSVLDKASQNRLGLNLAAIQANLKKLANAPEFIAALKKALELLDERQQARLLETEADVDSRLYEGFFGDLDRTKMSIVRAAEGDELKDLDVDFKDPRLEAMLPLYKARNFPETLTEDERKIWESFKQQKLLGGKQNSRLARYFERINELREQPRLSGEQRYLLDELTLYGESIMPADF